MAKSDACMYGGCVIRQMFAHTLVTELYMVIILFFILWVCLLFPILIALLRCIAVANDQPVTLQQTKGQHTALRFGQMLTSGNVTCKPRTQNSEMFPVSIDFLQTI